MQNFDHIFSVYIFCLWPVHGIFLVYCICRYEPFHQYRCRTGLQIQ